MSDRIIKEDDSCFIASEPAEAYAMAEHSLGRTGEFQVPSHLDPGIGPYTIMEVEQQLQEAEDTLRDASKWSTLSDIIADFKHEHQAWFK